MKLVFHTEIASQPAFYANTITNHISLSASQTQSWHTTYFQYHYFTHSMMLAARRYPSMILKYLLIAEQWSKLFSVLRAGTRSLACIAIWWVSKLVTRQSTPPWMVLGEAGVAIWDLITTMAAAWWPSVLGTERFLASWDDSPQSSD